jgi:hypothetical protein
MRRRKEDDMSSLDMLLDTICNMFGLLIFIAVIAAVLAQSRAQAPKSVPSTVNMPEVTEAPVDPAPDSEIEELDSDIAEAQQYIGELEAALARWAPPKMAPRSPRRTCNTTSMRCNSPSTPKNQSVRCRCVFHGDAR